MKTGLLIVGLVGVVIVAWRLYVLHYGKNATASMNVPKPVKHGDLMDGLDVEAIIEEMKSHALAYAIYREILEQPVDIDCEEVVFAKYGRVVTPPSLERNEIFDRRPELESDKSVLEQVNKWLCSHGTSAEPTFFKASDAVGEMLVREARGRARVIVQAAAELCGRT